MITEKLPCLVIGSGGHSRVVISILQEPEKMKYEIIGVLDLQTPKNNEKILGVPVLGKVDTLKKFCNKAPYLFLSIGENALRKEYFELGQNLGFQFPNLISNTVNVSPEVCLGKGNIICPLVHFGPCSVVGNNNIINTRSILEHESSIANHSHLAPGSVVCGRAKIGDEVFLGANATVIENITVANQTVIGAGTVVIKNIEISGMVHIGVPAKEKKDQ